jgi:hypothetical protein
MRRKAAFRAVWGVVGGGLYNIQIILDLLWGLRRGERSRRTEMQQYFAPLS